MRQALLDELALKEAAIDGDVPNEQAFSAARAFIAELPDLMLAASLYVSGDAEVGVSWTSPDGFFEVVFRGDGRLLYAHRLGNKLSGDSIPFEAIKPEAK